MRNLRTIGLVAAGVVLGGLVLAIVLATGSYWMFRWGCEAGGNVYVDGFRGAVCLSAR